MSILLRKDFGWLRVFFIGWLANVISFSARFARGLHFLHIFGHRLISILPLFERHKSARSVHTFDIP